MWLALGLGMAVLAVTADAQPLPVEAPRDTLVGVIIHRATPDDVESLWRGSPGGAEACNIIHNGYGGILARTTALLEACATRTGGRMRVLVRPNADDVGAYVKSLLRSPHADLILGWYIADEPFAFPWNADDTPRVGETVPEFWMRYRAEHEGKPPWPAEVAPERQRAEDLAPDEVASIRFRGGDDLFYLFRQRDEIRRAVREMVGEPACRNRTVREGGHLPIFADYGSLCPTYGMVDGGIRVGAESDERLGYWWYDEDMGAATWRENGTVTWGGEVVRRRFGAFGEDVTIVNWFGSPCDAQGRPRPRSHNRIDGALEIARRDVPETPVYFFLGYGQSAEFTRRNIELAEAEGEVAGYLLWSWGLSDSIHEAWLAPQPDVSWSAMIEALP
jgi:hypothetical protein